MKFQTLVGEDGLTQSGGQRQRILIARALYRRPKILVLDEATSHLDEETELRVSEAIRGLRISRIVVSHREATIATVDRVYVLNGGYASEQSSEGAMRTIADVAAFEPQGV